MRKLEALPDRGPVPEPELLVVLDDGDSVAFERFFEHYQAPVYRAALSLLHDPMAADEVVSDVFQRAYAARRRLDPGRSPGPWLHRVAVNAALSRLRARHRVEASIEQLADRDEPPDTGVSDVERRETAVELARSLERLPVETRTVVILRYVLGLTIREISEDTNAPASTVRDRIKAGLRQLRTGLLDELDAGEAERDRRAIMAEPAVVAQVGRVR